MKRFGILKMGMAAAGFCFALLTASAKEGAHGAPIDCGADKVVLFDDATSKDGRYAIGWTLRARDPKAKPVDWKLWDPDSPYDLFDKYDYLDENLGYPGVRPRVTPYELFECAVDLKKKRLLALRSDWPYWPNKNHADFQVVWSNATDGTQYAIVKNNARWFTENLWLVTAEESGMREMELSTRLNVEVAKIVKAKRPLTYTRFGLNWLANSDGTDVTTNIFTGSTVRLGFAAMIPKGDDSVEGSMTVSLARGGITKVVCDTPRDDPFKDNPELARADEELNRTYTELLQKLNGGQREALRKEQRAWLASRDEGAEGEDVAPSSQERDEALIKSTEERTGELRKRL
jgi:uncharacterized protein YecT (DUF1311 family)